MTPALNLLDSVDGGRGAGEAAGRRWYGQVERSLGSEPQAWVQVAAAGAVTRDRAWRLLGWVETTASRVAVERRPELLRTAAFALALLERSPLDRRDVMVVATLVRHAAGRAGMDFLGLAGAGCERAGRLGADTLAWLPTVPTRLPSTHEELGTGGYRRRPADADLARLQDWVGDGPDGGRPARRPDPARRPAASRPQPSGAGGVGIVLAAVAIGLLGVLMLTDSGQVSLVGPFVALLAVALILLLRSGWRR